MAVKDDEYRLRPYLYNVLAKSVFYDETTSWMLHEYPETILAHTYDEAISVATLDAASEIEKAQILTEKSGKNFSYQMFVKPF